MGERRRRLLDPPYELAEQLKLAGGFEGVLEMLDGWFLGVGRPNDGDDVEAHGALQEL